MVGEREIGHEKHAAPYNVLINGPFFKFNSMYPHTIQIMSFYSWNHDKINKIIKVRFIKKWKETIFKKRIKTWGKMAQGR